MRDNLPREFRPLPERNREAEITYGRSGTGPVRWDAYEHAPAPRNVANGARQVGLVNATSQVIACACGGEIVVNRRAFESDLVAAFASHQAEGRHRTWRHDNGID